VRVFRINNTSPNPDAARYQPTDYERAQEFGAANQADSAQALMGRFLADHPDNYSANLAVGDALLSAKEFDRACDSYRAVQRFAPGDPVSAIGLANAYLSRGGVESDPALFDSALVYFHVAAKSFWRDQRIMDMISQLERRKS
jgi:predicted Zn-dependent protease